MSRRLEIRLLSCPRRVLFRGISGDVDSTWVRPTLEFADRAIVVSTQNWIPIRDTINRVFAPVLGEFEGDLGQIRNMDQVQVAIWVNSQRSTALQ